MFFTINRQLGQQCCHNSIHIENTDIKHFENRDFSVVESFQVQVFRYEGLGFLGILGFFTISKPKINLKHTFYVNLCLKTIYRTLIPKYQNQKIGNRPIRIEIGITEAEIRIEAKQLSRKIMTALLGSISFISQHSQTYTLIALSFG